MHGLILVFTKYQFDYSIHVSQFLLIFLPIQIELEANSIHSELTYYLFILLEIKQFIRLD